MFCKRDTKMIKQCLCPLEEEGVTETDSPRCWARAPFPGATMRTSGSRGHLPAVDNRKDRGGSGRVRLLDRGPLWAEMETHISWHISLIVPGGHSYSTPPQVLLRVFQRLQPMLWPLLFLSLQTHRTQEFPPLPPGMSFHP